MINSELELGRAQFRKLLLSNPNYFGTYQDSDFEIVESIQCSTKYEEIGCVGFDPKFDKLEAVVYVKQPFGYGGGICTKGTPEYVRFHLSFDDGATWHDQGYVSFRAYDIPDGTVGKKRLEYAVALSVKGLGRFCFFTRTVKCRAILSWNNIPTAGDPHFIPVWGNVHDTYLLTEPSPFLTLGQFTEDFQVNIPDNLLQQIDLTQEIKLDEPAALSVKELHSLYREEADNVLPSRYGFAEVQTLLSTAGDDSITNVFAASPLAQLDVDLSEWLAPDDNGDGSVAYEELECVGLFPNEDLLIGTFRVKLPAGYSGNPCTAGSKEYVTFWADFNDNGTFETYLGTASVSVYDFKKIPKEGLEYAVTLPVDFTKYRQPCQKGPRLVRIRAILSWNTPPDPTNPDYVPTWGNREETIIHIAPGPIWDGPAAIITRLGGISVKQIHDLTGLTMTDAEFSNGRVPDSLGRPCPFARRVVVLGPQFPGYRYRVQVREYPTSAWSTVITPIRVIDINGVSSMHSPLVDGTFTYLGHSQNFDNTLAWWDTARDKLWDVRLEIFNLFGVNPIGSVTHRIQLDNTRPLAEIDITNGGGNCGTFAVGDSVEGMFKARDLYLGSYNLRVLPADTNPNLPSPSGGTVQTPVGGTMWKLDTSGMKPCGYVVRVTVADRAIVDSVSGSHHTNSDAAGFCLVEGE